MKIYTKKGDHGDSYLLGGTKVKKNDLRLEAYGTIDELNAYIGYLNDNILIENDVLIKIQRHLFNLGSILSNDGRKSGIILPVITKKDINMLENKIDKMESKLTPLREFILPTGHTQSSLCHITRTICRRAERRVVQLQNNIKLDENCLMYLNRLSDYLFVLARLIMKENGCKEIPWIKH